MKLTLVKQLNNTFKAAYDSDYETMKKIKVGDFLECDIKKPRNYEFHKKYFALLNMVFDNQERYSNITDLRHDLTLEIGYYTLRRNLSGDMIKIPNSISFASMDELTFNDLYSKTIKSIVKHFGFIEQDILDNIEQFF